ncbi:conjugal transfer protein TraG [Lactobacillus jensenii]|uniref:Conjugal transfer protein TraG n=1 Tax=Lactobacillus jensenii TaxID=109790 RepID=A0A5N1IA81_LACJE|nr:conjugal transfer protein TraG [Lactobacillus jensenii]
MKVRKVKKVKRTSLIKRTGSFFKQVFLSLRKETIDGANLPDNREEHQKDIRLFVAVISSVALFIVLVIFVNAGRLTFQTISRPGFNFLTQKIDDEKIFAQAINIAKYPLPFKWLIAILAISFFGGFGLSKRLKFATKDVAYGQKGDERFTTEKELEKQYPIIPDHDERGDE